MEMKDIEVNVADDVMTIKDEKKVERPDCTIRRTVPPQPSVRQGWPSRS